MRRYTLRPPTTEDLRCAGRWLRRLDDHGLEAGERDHCARVALPPKWRTRDRLRGPLWPPQTPDTIHVWAAIGASDALSMTPPRAIDQRPHALAYTAAWTAVMGAYMSNDEQSIDDAITSHDEPGPRDTSEHGDPHSLAWSAEIGKIAGAYARAQASMGELVAIHKAKIKTNKGADFEYSFANIADALKACLGAFNAEGCAVLQPVTTFKGGVEVRTVVIHESGQWLRSGILVLPAHGDAQAIGSAITYARRYQILGMVGLAPSDDDGASATASTRSGSGHDYEHRTAPSDAPQRKTDAIGARCSGKGWPGDLGREVHQLAQDLATLGGADPMDVWWDLLPVAGVEQQPYMDTDGAWPAHARVLSTKDGKLVKAEALKKIADARQT